MDTTISSFEQASAGGLDNLETFQEAFLDALGLLVATAMTYEWVGGVGRLQWDVGEDGVKGCAG